MSHPTSSALQLPQALTAAPAWHTLDKVQRKACWRAACKLVGSMQALAEEGQQVVQKLTGADTFLEWEHYPDGDVRDDKHASQYFYHAHSALQRPFEEHGHFHLFIHPDKLAMRRANGRYAPSPAHLIAVSMDAQGVPNGFFIVNRWVSKGAWLSHAHCARALQHFAVKGRHGERHINQFLHALLGLYQHHILALLRQRDDIMQQLCVTRDRRSVFADRQIEVLCHAPVALLDDIAALEECL